MRPSHPARGQEPFAAPGNAAGRCGSPLGNAVIRGECVMKTNSLWAALKVTLPICAGIAAGISSALLVSQRSVAIEQKPTTFAEQQAPQNTPATGREDTKAVRSRLAAVEQE